MKEHFVFSESSKSNKKLVIRINAVNAILPTENENSYELVLTNSSHIIELGASFFEDFFSILKKVK